MYPTLPTSIHTSQNYDKQSFVLCDNSDISDSPGYTYFGSSDRNQNSLNLNLIQFEAKDSEGSSFEESEFDESEFDETQPYMSSFVKMKEEEYFIIDNHEIENILQNNSRDKHNTQNVNYSIRTIIEETNTEE